MKNDLCVLDVETTGPNPKEDKIVQISIAKYLGNKIEQNGLHYTLTISQPEIKTMLINPGRPIPAAATEVHKITDEMVKGAPLFKQIAKSLHDFIFGCDMLTYNGLRFDCPLLYNEFSRAGIIWDFKKVNLIDACNIYKINEPRTLEAAYKFYSGGDMTGMHDAEADVLGTALVFAKQVDKYKLGDKTGPEMALYSNYDKPILDLSGVFTLDDKGNIVFAIGKHKGTIAKNEKSYLQWLLGADFNADTKSIAQSLLYA